VNAYVVTYERGLDQWKGTVEAVSMFSAVQNAYNALIDYVFEDQIEITSIVKKEG